MKNVIYDTLLFDGESIFTLESTDSQIRLDGLNQDELTVLLGIVERSPGVNIACFPYCLTK